MESVRLRDVSVERCAKCRGTWIGAAAFEALLAPWGGEPKLSGVAQAGEAGRHLQTAKRCPACPSHPALAPVRVRGVEVALCEQCRGILFDPGEAVRILRKRAPLSERMQRRFGTDWDQSNAVLGEAALFVLFAALFGRP